MSDPIKRWVKEQEAEHDHYAALAGFEKDIAEHDDLLNEAYHRLDIYEKLTLFTLVCSWMDEATTEEGCLKGEVAE